MKPVKVLTIVGTRPEAIKLAPVILELASRETEFVSKVCFTGQHRQMLDQAMTLFGISADYDLDVMIPGQSLAGMTARIIERLEEVFQKEQPDVVLVQGDTTTAFCGALVAFYHQVKIGHVEAGLRTYEKYAPFPEEINRQMVSRLADFHFAPTETARQALLKEGIADSTIFVTGNTVIDALLWIRQRVDEQSMSLTPELIEIAKKDRVVLVTGHRRENFGEGFDGICNAIHEVADRFGDVHFIYPVHLNPNVQEPVRRILGNHSRIHLIDPLPYSSLVWLMSHAYLVLTDSGGLQEEAPSFEKPVLVMRDTTERPEGIAAGCARLVGTDQKNIVDALSLLLNDPNEYARMANVKNPYGDGKAAERIADVIAVQR